MIRKRNLRNRVSSRNSNKRLYETIMKDIAKTVKRHLNENFIDQKPNIYDIKVQQLYDIIESIYDINDDIYIYLDYNVKVDIPIYDMETGEVDYVAKDSLIKGIYIDMDNIDDSNLIDLDGEQSLGILSYDDRIKVINACIRTLNKN